MLILGKVIIKLLTFQKYFFFSSEEFHEYLTFRFRFQRIFINGQNDVFF